jgi:hypothetical protein
MLRGELQQARGQLAAGLRAERAPLVERRRFSSQLRALPRDPCGMPFRKRFGFATRTTSRNRDADAPVDVDA